MRAVLVLCLAVVLAQARSEYVDMFNAFKSKYHRQYASQAEESQRFRIFAQNMRRAAELSSSNPHAQFGVNEFADLSAEEFKTRHNAERFYKAHRDAGFPTRVMTAAEKSVAAGQQQDWRPKGAVTPIKNQGQCGSCWAFSTTGGIEGQWFLAGNKLTSLSEQELTSCDTIDAGCNGGLMDNAFTWLLQAHNGSIVTEASYPYVSGNGNVPACQMTNKKFGAQIDGFKNLEHNEDSMAAFVYASGPLSIGVDATSWQTYTGGIMTNCQSVQVDHGVLIVGFDDNNSPPYWIVKNSWGRSWGEDGFIRVEKGTDQCLITSNPCTSEVKKAGPTPSPGPGPSPPPTPFGKTFTQKTCIDRKCDKCTSMTFDQNKCITGANASYSAYCITDGLVVSSYTSRDCSGSAVTTVNPINQCSIIFRKTGDERFVQNLCGAAPTPAPGPTSGPTPAPGPTAPPAPTPAPTFPSGWLNLFAPPFSNVPTITMAISAIDNATSYVPGGENGSGFTVFEFNNEENGQFTPLQMPDMALMILAIATGGTRKDPKGVVGGIGIGNGIQYFANTTTVLPSTVPTLLVQTQDARMSRDGARALIVDGASNSVLFSSDSGKTFNEKPIKLPMNNCTGARYAAMVDSNTYYVTLGSWPSNNNNAKSTFHVTEAMAMTRGADGKVKRQLRQPRHQHKAPRNVEAGSGSSSSSSGGGGDNCQGYTAMLVKTTDGGNTWKAQINPTNPNYYFNAIDCASATHCIAVGEGFNQGAGGHVFVTTDGETWKETLFEASGAQGQFSFMSIRFVGTDGKQAWIGGSLMVSQIQSEAKFYHTADGGKTWKVYPHGIPDLAAVSTIDFLPDGIGFATAMTIYDDSTILRYDPSGPPPPGYFIQSQCPTKDCNFLCQNVSFPQDMCLGLSNGGSALAMCTATSVEQKVYQTTDCTGSFNVTSMPLDKCLDDNGNYFENYCPRNQAERMPARGKAMFTQRRREF